MSHHRVRAVVKLGVTLGETPAISGAEELGINAAGVDVEGLDHASTA
jgi:hypothetical protein